MIAAMWQHVDRKHIIDKNRGWGKNMPAAEILFGYPVKMIATIRDLPSIMASWLTILHANPNSLMDTKLLEKGIPITDFTRMEEMWENMVRDCYEGLHQAINDRPNEVLLISYEDLVKTPKVEINKIEKFLGIPEYDYDFNNITSNTIDDDLSAWGLENLHLIRSKLEKTSKDPRTILGTEMFEYYSNIDKQFWNQVTEQFKRE
jgi:hypothetical protein